MIMEKVKRFISNLRHLNAHISDLQKLEADVQLLHNRIQLLTDENSNLRNQIEKQNQTMNDCYTFIKNENEKLFLDCEEMLTRRMSEMRSRFKAQLGHPMRVVFLCELPSLWNSFHTIISAMQKDSRFEVVLVRLWCKQYSENGTYTYVAEDFSKISEKINQCFIESYNPETNTWLDLKKMEPDYVFYMRPYDYYRNEDYHISCVSKYTKTCYIPYGMTIMGGDVEKFASPVEFCQYLYYYFLDTPLRKPLVTEEYGYNANLIEARVACLGYPRMDIYREKIKLKDPAVEIFTMLWLPRWNTSENCCNFFEYKDILPKYTLEHENCRLIFRPHPLCFRNFLSTGELSDKEMAELLDLYDREPNLVLDESGDYLESFVKSDILIADETSLIAEYFATGKPIVFCRKETHFSKLMSALADGIYFADNWNDLSSIISSLKKGEDPLYNIRQAIIKKELFQTTISSGELIKEKVAKDFFDLC